MPIQNLKRKLQFSGKKHDYVRECMRVANLFVAKYGRKQRYTQHEILEFLDWLDKRYEKKNDDVIITPGRETSSYVTKVNQFKRFLESLPEDEATGRKQIVPFELPSFPDKFYQPAFSQQDIEEIIYTAIMEERPAVVLRIALATIYGCRCGEIAKMSSHCINLDHSQPSVDIPTEKKGRRIPQPIPQELVPLFSIPLKQVSKIEVIRQLKRVCRKAGVPCTHGTGVHAIRRSGVTSLYSNTNLKEISIRRFMRWSLGVDMGVMPRYVKTPLEVTDIEVLNQHPYIFMWKELLSLKNYLPQYKNLLQFNKIANPKLDEIYTRRPHLAKLKEKLKQLRHRSKHRRNA